MSCFADPRFADHDIFVEMGGERICEEKGKQCSDFDPFCISQSDYDARDARDRRQCTGPYAQGLTHHKRVARHIMEECGLVADPELGDEQRECLIRHGCCDNNHILILPHLRGVSVAAECDQHTESVPPRGHKSLSPARSGTAVTVTASEIYEPNV